MYLLEVSVATNMKKSEKTKQNKKPSGSAKHNKMKHKTRYYCTCACVLSCFSHVRIFVTLRTVVLQAPLSMGFSRQECWSGLPCPPRGIFLTQGLNPHLLHWQVDSLHQSHQGSPVPTYLLHLSKL